MDKSRGLDDDRIPTYEESESTKRSMGQEALSLPRQLASVRTTRIHSIVNVYINPLLQEQAFAGLYKTTIVLVPSNAISLQSSASGHDIIEGSGDAVSHNAQEALISFPDEDYVKLVRLHGEEDTMEFWRQTAVIKELENCLKASLLAGGHHIHESPKPQATPPSAVFSPMPEPAKAKRGFFSRRNQNDLPTIPATLPSAISESSDVDSVLPGHVRVGVSLEEVVLRVVTDMGLYDTRTGKAVVVKMEIGS